MDGNPGANALGRTRPTCEIAQLLQVQPTSGFIIMRTQSRSSSAHDRDSPLLVGWTPINRGVAFGKVVRAKTGRGPRDDRRVVQGVGHDGGVSVAGPLSE